MIWRPTFLESGVLHEVHEEQNNVTEDNCGLNATLVLLFMWIITRWLLWILSSAYFKGFISLWGKLGFHLSKESLQRPLQVISSRVSKWQISGGEYPETGREWEQNHEVSFMSYEGNQILWWTKCSLSSLDLSIEYRLEHRAWCLIKYFYGLDMTRDHNSSLGFQYNLLKIGPLGGIWVIGVPASSPDWSIDEFIV